jgi:hypothetical protein
MSDQDKGPLHKREKGLEDEWIRRKEAEQLEEQRRQKESGDLTTEEEPRSPQTEDGDGREGDGRKMFIALGVAIIFIILFALVF